MGPLLFALAVDDIARSISSPLNIWYLDDASIGGPPDAVFRDLARIIPALSAIGLELNSNKSEIINLDSIDTDFAQAVDDARSFLPSLHVTDHEDLSILGSPIHSKTVIKFVEERCNVLTSVIERLKLIDSHPALFLLCNVLALPRLLFTLRSAPCYALTSSLQNFDEIVRCAAESICNVIFDGPGWSQATLPVSLGGIGLRCASDLALPAYASSIHASQSLSNEILHNLPEFSVDHAVSDTMAVWQDIGLDIPVNKCKQRSWDMPLCISKVGKVKEDLDQHRLACFAAASQPYSGAWLNAIPSASVGNLLDDDCVRFGVALRLGLQVCQSHRCRCGATVDIFGLHPLSCRLSAGRIPRHCALNDIIRRALNTAGFHSILEPVGLDRGDGKRPDGLTVFPFQSGKSLVWDATCTDTFSPSAIMSSACEPGSAARAAEDRKISKYSALSSRLIFQPIAVETSGVIGPQTLSFLKGLGKKICKETGDPRDSHRLFQRISLAVLRGNCMAFVTAFKHD